MDFRILGPLEVCEEGRELPLGGAKQRALLALLLLRANELVPTERIVEELWGERPPPTATKTVQVYVSQLRRALGRELVQTRGPGYVLRLPRAALDLHRFDDSLAEGRRLLVRGAAAEARATLDDALALWRGEALAEFRNEPFAQSEIARLEELRLAALELRLEAGVELGRHVEAVPELEVLVRQHPLRESLRRLLMLALYRGGRQAEALAAYQDTRVTLVEELGIEPSQALQQLEKAILLQDTALDLPAPPAPTPPAPVPARIQAPVPDAAPAVDQPAEARKTVTVLFCDVVASTELGERLDPEAQRALMGRFYEEAAAVLERHGGRVEKFIGDEVMAVFGVPVVREDDALRGARAALELVEAVAQRLPELQVRIGVNTGEVVAGDATAGHGFVTGDAVNVGKRLEEAAAPGEILLGSETYGLVAHAVQGRMLEPVALKGKREPHVPFRLAAVDEDAPAFLRRDDTPLVGRGLELERLRGLFDAVAAGGGAQLVTICGDAGIGKSRLVRALLADLGPAATVLIGRCPPYGEGVTFLPLRELLRHAGREERELGATSHEIFANARAVVEELAQEAPVVAVFEDVHWAEPTFLDLVEYLQGRLATARVLLVCLARPELAERRPSWLQEPAVAISLRPLSAVESELLLDELGAPEPVRAGIAEAAEGNPLFVEQLVAIAGEQKPLPASIRGVLAERLDRLDRGERAVLERAAVAGRSFSVDAVIHLSPPELGDEVHRRLLALARARLLRPDPVLPDGFRFQHALIRDAAYDGIPKSLRAELHRQMADLPADDALVGFHLEQAYRYHEQLGGAEYALAAQAGRLLARAGRDALRGGDAPAGVSLLGRSAALLPDDDPSCAAVYADLGSAQMKTGEFSAAAGTLAEAAEAARRTGDRRAGLRAALEQQFLSSFSSPGDADVVRRADKLIPQLEAAGDELGLAKALWLRSEADVAACRWQARADALERALGHARRAEDVGDEAGTIVAQLAQALYYGPTPVPAAIERCRELLADAGADRPLRAALTSTLAGLHAMRGEVEPARRLYADAVAVYDELGLRFRRASRASIGAQVELAAGDAAAAEHGLRAAIDELAQIGAHGVHATLGAVLADLLGQLGRDEEAAELAHEVAGSVAEDDLAPQALWRSTLAGVHARAGELDEADRLAQEALALAEQTDFPALRVSALVAAADVAEQLGRPEAHALLADARALCEVKGDVVAAQALAARLERSVV
jgi:class 3 adenylate cyclase/DNA-binding SARP family transcriptional activator